MDKLMGLYVTLLPDGRIKKDLTDENGEVTEFETSLTEELILYSEMLYEPYENLMRYAVWLMDNRADLEDPLEADDKVFTIVDTVMSMLNERNPFSARLLHLHIANLGGIVSAPALCKVIDENLQSITAAQAIINCALHDIENGIPIDTDGKYSLIKQYEFREFNIFDGTQLQFQYYFQMEAGYMIFLLMKFVESKQRVVRCRYCGRFFVPRTNRTTLYCDRIVKDGKTCKDLAPQAMHKADADNQKVIKEYDRAKQRMYKRYERAGYGKKPSPKDLTRDEYFEWVRVASDARDKFLAGELTEEEALAIIIVP